VRRHAFYIGKLSFFHYGRLSFIFRNAKAIQIRYAAGGQLCLLLHYFQRRHGLFADHHRYRLCRRPYAKAMQRKHTKHPWQRIIGPGDQEYSQA
jgi:hypothetical protein